MTEIINIVITLVIKLLGLWLDKYISDKETHKAFLNFIDKMQNLSLSSVKLNASLDAQKKRIEAKLKELDGNA